MNLGCNNAQARGQNSYDSPAHVATAALSQEHCPLPVSPDRPAKLFWGQYPERPLILQQRFDEDGLGKSSHILLNDDWFLQLFAMCAPNL